MEIRRFSNTLIKVLFFFSTLLLLTGCITPIASFETIGITSNTIQQDSNTLNYPFIFYNECSRNGSAWLYECQNIGLHSLYDAIKLEKPAIQTIQNIQMSFYPNKTYILFEIYDSTLHDNTLKH